MAERRKFTKAFKENALELVANRDEGKSVEEVCKELGISSGQLYRWKAAAEKAKAEGTKAFPGNGNPRDEELARLRKENRQLREANAILKKAAAILLLAPLRSMSL
jgi:transposase-like protein